MNRLPLLMAALPFVVFAHPHDAPFTFIQHRMSDGHPVYTNIPQSCFKDGIMTCYEYHPVAGNHHGSVVTEQGATIRMKEPDAGMAAPGSAADKIR